VKYASLRQGLVGAWCPSLGPSGNTLIDRSGYGNHGTLTNMDAGTDWVGSRYGWALDYDGVDDRVVTSRSVMASQFTISAWVLRTRTSSLGYQRIFGQASFVFEFASLGSDLFVYDGSWKTVATNAPPINQWSFCAVSYDGSTLTAWCDGVAFAPVSGGRALSGISYIGSSQDSGQNLWQGPIADLRVYSRVLTQSELKLLNTEPAIGIKPERTSVFFGADLFSAAWLSRQSTIIGGGVA